MDKKFGVDFLVTFVVHRSPVETIAYHRLEPVIQLGKTTLQTLPDASS
jgi:hypothetical protein